MEYHYDTNSLMEFINTKIIGLTPSKIPENAQQAIPASIWNTMNKNMQKDIQELFMVYNYEQWTATLLMSFRVLESTLRIHVEYDLEMEEVRNLSDSIKMLEKKKYPEQLIEKLNIYRDKRNNFVHGFKRASPTEAKDTLGFVLSLALQIYNIKPK